MKENGGLAGEENTIFHEIFPLGPFWDERKGKRMEGKATSLSFCSSPMKIIKNKKKNSTTWR